MTFRPFPTFWLSRQIVKLVITFCVSQTICQNKLFYLTIKTVYPICFSRKSEIQKMLSHSSRKRMFILAILSLAAAAVSSTSFHKSKFPFLQHVRHLRYVRHVRHFRFLICSFHHADTHTHPHADTKERYTVRIKDLDNLNLLKIRSGDKVLGSSQFLLLSQLPQKTMLASKVVKNNSKIVISLC